MTEGKIEAGQVLQNMVQDVNDDLPVQVPKKSCDGIARFNWSIGTSAY